MSTAPEAPKLPGLLAGSLPRTGLALFACLVGGCSGTSTDAEPADDRTGVSLQYLRTQAVEFEGVDGPYEKDMHFFLLENHDPVPLVYTGEYPHWPAYMREDLESPGDIMGSFCLTGFVDQVLGPGESQKLMIHPHPGSHMRVGLRVRTDASEDRFEVWSPGFVYHGPAEGMVIDPE